MRKRPSSARSTRPAVPRPGPPRARTEEGAARAWWIALALLFVAALVWRLLYVRRLDASPFGASPVSDARLYWEWAGEILRGGPIGTQPFFLAPLYPYALSMLRAVTGDSMGAVRIIQAVWGAAAVVLLADAARRLGRPAIGVVVGVLVAFYEQAVFFDGLLLTESLLFALEALLLWLVARRDWSAARPLGFALVGALIGLIAEGRAAHVLLVVPALAVLVPAGASAWPVRLARAGGLLAGLALVVAPVALRNRVIAGGEWIPFTYSLGYNLYVGNHPGAQGVFATVTGARAFGAAGPAEGGTALDGRAYLREVEGLRLTAAQSSAEWSRRAVDWMRENPGGAAALTMRRLALMWNRREFPQVEFADEFRAVAGPLGLPWLGGFALLGALGLGGLLLARGAGPGAAFAAGYVLAISLGIVPFFVTDRFRHHLVPGLALLAAVLLARAWQAWRGRALGQTLRVGVAAALGLVVVCLPAPGPSREAAAWRTATSLGGRWLERGRTDLAATEFEKALALESAGLRGLDDPAMAPERAALYFNHAVAMRRLDRPEEAARGCERALAVAPDHVDAAYTLAGIHWAAGRAAAAESLEARLEGMPGGAGRAHASRAWRADASGDRARAESLFVLASRASPEFEDAWGQLIRIRAQSRRLAEAEATLEDARRAGLSPVPLAVYQALLAALRGDRTTAERALASLPPGGPPGDPNLADLVAFTRRLLERR